MRTDIDPDDEGYEEIIQDDYEDDEQDENWKH